MNSFMRACALTELPFPALAYFHFQKLRPSNFPLGVGRASVSIYSGSAWVRNVIRATVGKRHVVGCGFKSGGCGRVWVYKIRPVQDSDLSDHFNPLVNYQAKFLTFSLHCQPGGGDGHQLRQPGEGQTLITVSWVLLAVNRGGTDGRTDSPGGRALLLQDRSSPKHPLSSS